METGWKKIGVIGVDAGMCQGDGFYPVYAKFKDGIVSEIKITFIDNEDED